ncbi:hypothetical protein CPB84DRAFT_1967539 [Gymnopilus junonius]|uniref:Protein kinase domain-containing protein n=1 Tax=Gymnopilus junonius TaxID=109634 RepID=A0A9P5N8C8_GYMJU|nr:hypothetical protein CPB84DRAFT_1967539 [Gymnopilus junonius]
MSGHFLGPIPPKEFLKSFLSKELDMEDWPIDKKGLSKRLSRIPLTGNEVEMYQPFIEAFKDFIPGMQFRDTHANPDGRRDNLATDIAVYDSDDLPEGTITDFSKMSIFLEFKSRPEGDPFRDPKNYKKPKADNFRFESADDKPTENRGQIGSYAAAIAGSQFRLHLFSVSICRENARLIRWDRAGAVVTQSFNYKKEPELLADFFWRYSHLDLRQKGYDPTCSVALEEDITKMGDYERDLQEANSIHREFRKLLVPDRKEPDKGSQFIISYPPYYESYSPFARATRGMLAYDLEADALVYLKDYWRADADGMEKEGDIYTILEDYNVPNIAPFGQGNDVEDHRTLTHLLRSFEWACWTVSMVQLRQYRMTLKVVGHPLTDFSSSREFVSAVADAMEAHDVAYFDARILHRDISVGNILITEEGKGLLIDWDLCIDLRREATGGRRPSRTGTWQFMSAALLKSPSSKHDIEDDRESAFYVLIWTALRYSKHITRPTPTSGPARDDVVEFLRGFDEYYLDASGNPKGGVAKSAFMLGKTLSRAVQFDGRPQLDILLRVLNNVFKVRYEGEPEEEELQELKDLEAKGPSAAGSCRVTVAYKYFDRLKQLGERGWLVQTIRTHLGTTNWPQDDVADPQEILPKTGSKRKMMQDQENLHGRIAKRRGAVSAPL